MRVRKYIKVKDDVAKAIKTLTDENYERMRRIHERYAGHLIESDVYVDEGTLASNATEIKEQVDIARKLKGESTVGASTLRLAIESLIEDGIVHKLGHAAFLHNRHEHQRRDQRMAEEGRRRIVDFIRRNGADVVDSRLEHIVNQHVAPSKPQRYKGVKVRLELDADALMLVADRLNRR